MCHFLYGLSLLFYSYTSRFGGRCFVRRQVFPFNEGNAASFAVELGRGGIGNTML